MPIVYDDALERIDLDRVRVSGTAETAIALFMVKFHTFVSSEIDARLSGSGLIYQLDEFLFCLWREKVNCPAPRVVFLFET